MRGIKNIKEIVNLKSKIFRKVMFTSNYLKVESLRLNPGEETGVETNQSTDQFFKFEGGTGVGIINGNEYKVENGDTIVVPAGSSHNVINTDPSEGLMMYVVYGPPSLEGEISDFIKREPTINTFVFEGKRTG
jgi:mannose-6-phosphate isomerase-like protein (cupin superfamily)